MTYDFKFSVLMPIYNVEDYIGNAIDSIINQSIGFEENIELVIVDDSSPDNSKDIALKYQEMYPNNIKIYSKPNGGQASAFNLGMDYLHGKYISFVDSDDCVSPNTFQEVYDFFEEHGDEVDLVSIPLIYFERRTGPHVLNYKFESTRVIDLTEEPENPLLSIASSFIKREALDGLEFDTTLPHAYDSLVINKILLNKKKMGVIASCSYYYRKRYAMTSMIDNARQNERYYTHLFKNFYMHLIDYSIEKEGHVPKFIQYVMAYNLQWFHSTSDFPEFFTKEKIDEFLEIFYEVLSYIEDDIIKDSTIIKKKIASFFLLYLKNRKDFHIDTLDEESKIFLKTGNSTINNLHNHKFYIDDVKLDDGFLRILGTFTSLCDYDVLNIEAIKTLADGKTEVYKEQLSDFSMENSKVKRIFGIDWQFKHAFDLRIPMGKDEESKIDLNLIYDENNKRIVLKNKIKFRNSTLLTDKINYFVKDSQIVFFEDNSFNVCPFSQEKYDELKDELLSHNQEILVNVKKLEKKEKALEKENKKLKKDISKLEEKNKQILNSSSWKITKPFRKFKQLIKI